MPPTGLPSWTDIPAGDYDPDSPITSALFTSIIQNIEHNYQWLGSGFTPSEAHDHDGVNSALLQIPGINFLVAPAIDENWNGWWSKSGFSVLADEGFQGTNSGDYVYQDIMQPTYDTMFGSGSNFVFSVFAKASSALTTGEYRFGVASNSTSTYATGARFDVPQSLLTTGWQRFWGTADVDGSDINNNFRWLNRIETTFDAAIVINCFNFMQGSVLTWFQIETMGRRAHYGDGKWSQFWFLPENVPCFDEDVAMTNAVKITGV